MVREQDRGKPYFGALPFAVQSFQQMREGGYIYVDKTDLIWEIANGPMVQFFARPRRFGKSLMISTLKSYFEGRADLFEGLKIEEKRNEAGQTEWLKHPTFTFDFSGSGFTNEDSVYQVVTKYLTPHETKFSLPHEGEIGIRLARLIEAAYKPGEPRPAILIDEYDNPLTETLTESDRELHLHYKKVLRGFYKTIKENTEKLHLVVITGITQFGQLGIFSGMNQLVDQSTYRPLATLCGITEEELVENFRPQIEALAEALKTDFDGAVNSLRAHYDGYRFTSADIHIYNPQSLLHAFHYGKIGNYWANTGTSALLATVFPDYSYRFDKLKRPVRTEMDDLKQIDTTGKNPLPLLYQSGYLSIKKINQQETYVELGFPNREVRSAFWHVILPLYSDDPPSRSPFLEDLKYDQIEVAMQQLEGLVAGIPYSKKSELKHPPLYEELVQSAIYAWFNAMAVYAQTEVHSIKGRADVVIHLENRICILELKVGPRRETAAEALGQIGEKGYAKPYLGRGLPILGIGVSIDTREETRGDMEWISEWLHD